MNLDAWHALSLRRTLLLVLFPGLLAVVGAELWLTWRTAVDAANAAYDRSLLGAIKAIDANISTASGGLGVELPYRMLEFFELTANGRVFYRVATDDGLVEIGNADLPPPPRTLVTNPASCRRPSVEHRARRRRSRWRRRCSSAVVRTSGPRRGWPARCGVLKSRGRRRRTWLGTSGRDPSRSSIRMQTIRIRGNYGVVTVLTVGAGCPRFARSRVGPSRPTMLVVEGQPRRDRTALEHDSAP